MVRRSSGSAGAKNPFGVLSSSCSAMQARSSHAYHYPIYKLPRSQGKSDGWVELVRDCDVPEWWCRALFGDLPAPHSLGLWLTPAFLRQNDRNDKIAA